MDKIRSNSGRFTLQEFLQENCKIGEWLKKGFEGFAGISTERLIGFSNFSSFKLQQKVFSLRESFF